MADIFMKPDVHKLLNGKTIYFMGDSNMRAVYKDLVQLSVRNSLLSQGALKSKLEKRFNGDELVYHGPMSKAREYREERAFKKDGFHAKFYFITRCYDDYVENILSQMQSSPPDVVIFNSCLWDVSRWGPGGVNEYKKNMEKLMKQLKKTLHPSCLFIWTTTLPLSQECYGGFLIKQVEFLKHTLRFDVMEANLFTSQKVSESGFDVLDLHYYVKWQIHRRAKDGIHWLPHVVRHITNLILTHVCLAWNAPLPGRIVSTQLTDKINMCDENSETESDRESIPDENLYLDQDQRANKWGDPRGLDQDNRPNCHSRQREDQFSFQSEPIVQLQHQNHDHNNFQFGNRGNVDFGNFDNRGNRNFGNFDNRGNGNFGNFDNRGNGNFGNFDNRGNGNFDNRGNGNFRNFDNRGRGHAGNVGNFDNMGSGHAGDFDNRGSGNFGNFDNRGSGHVGNFDNRDNGNFGNFEDPGIYGHEQFPNPFDAVPDRRQDFKQSARRANQRQRGRQGRGRGSPRGNHQHPYNWNDY